MERVQVLLLTSSVPLVGDVQLVYTLCLSIEMLASDSIHAELITKLVIQWR